MATVIVTARIEITEEDPIRFAESLVEYLTIEEAPFIDDYGPHAWGGYDGSHVEKIGVQVELSTQAFENTWEHDSSDCYTCLNPVE